MPAQFSQDYENRASQTSRGVFHGSPVAALEQFSRDRLTGLIRFSNGNVSWIVRLENGKLTYVNNSVEPFERLLTHLAHLNQDAPKLTKELFPDLRQMFKHVVNRFAHNSPNFLMSDYAVLCWLVTRRYISSQQASRVAQAVICEAIEPLFWLEEVTYECTSQIGNTITFCQVEFTEVALQCFQRLTYWHLLSPHISSIHQRPYFFGQTEQQRKLLPELQLHQKFSAILRGFSIRQISDRLKKDELHLAASLIPFICEEIVILRDPHHPYELLPKIPSTIPPTFQRFADRLKTGNQGDAIASEQPLQLHLNPVAKSPKTYKIVCVDDSPIVLTEIGRFLKGEEFELITFADPMKAMAQILKIAPDLILLDVMMPHLNGYDFCKFLRKNPVFKQTPIVMITGNLMDRAKSNLAGATDYLAKPFNQAELLRKIFSLVD